MPLPLSALQVDLTTTPTAIPTPCVSTSGHRAQLKKWDCTASDKTPGQYRLQLTYETQEPITDTRGLIHAPGWTLLTGMTLPGGPPTSSEKMTEEQMKELVERQFCSWLDASRGSDSIPRPAPTDDLFNSFIGKDVLLVYKKAKDDSFGETQCNGFKPVSNG